MSGARQIELVALREIRERGRSRAFLASLALMVLCVAAAVALPTWLDSGSVTKDVGLTGAVPSGFDAVLVAHGSAADTTIRVSDYDTLTAGEAALGDGDIDVLVVDAERLVWRQHADQQLLAVVTGTIQLVAVRERAAAAGIDADALMAVVEPMDVTSVELGRTSGRTPEDETAAFLMTVVLFFAISTYGAMVLSGVVEEKSSRTVEVLLARMPARNLLAGKIAGIGLLGLAQIAATALAALVAASLTDAFDVAAVRGSVLAWAVVWFVLGYGLYATLFGTLGSLASRTEDASSVTGAVSVVLVIAFFASFATIGSVGSAWARLVAWFPLTAPLAMPNRIAMGAATWWEPVMVALLVAVTIAGLVVVGGRIYIRAILHTGATIRLGDAWRGAPVPTQHEPRAESASSGKPGGVDRAELALAAAAGVVGVLTFILAGDFVIGVGVGTAVFAAARYVLRVSRTRTGDRRRTRRRARPGPPHR